MDIFLACCLLFWFYVLGKVDSVNYLCHKNFKYLFQVYPLWLPWYFVSVLSLLAVPLKLAIVLWSYHQLKTYFLFHSVISLNKRTLLIEKKKRSMIYSEGKIVKKIYMFTLHL